MTMYESVSIFYIIRRVAILLFFLPCLHRRESMSLAVALVKNSKALWVALAVAGSMLGILAFVLVLDALAVVGLVVLYYFLCIPCRPC